ncbi:MAG: hypothetical protein ACRCV9_17985 [Burkholderiaceae bacterium]
MQRLLDRHEKKLRQDRNRALLALDLEWGKAMFPGAPAQDVLIAMHKARYHSTDLPRLARHQSAQWLRDNKHLDAMGQPVLPEGLLPR